MRRRLTIGLLAALWPALAAAQDTTGQEGPIPDPNVPDPNLPPESTLQPPPYRWAKRDYPRELVKRPLTLAEDQAELSIDIPMVYGDGHPALTQVLRGAYGVTVDLQLGLTYAVGLELLNAPAGADSFEVGKAFSLDGAYTIIPNWLAAQARVAFYADPDVFGVALVLGVPFKIQLGNEWKIFGGADLITIKLHKLPVYPADPAQNLASVALIDRGGNAPAGSVDFTGGVAYQAQPNLAVWGTVGLGWPDFDTNDQPFSMFAGLTYSPRRFWDLGARLGFVRLDEPADTFSLGLFAALRM